MGLGKSVEVISAILSHTAPAATTPLTIQERIAALPPADPSKKAPRYANDKSRTVPCGGCGQDIYRKAIGARVHEELPDPLLCAQCCLALSHESVPGVAKATLIVCPQAIQAQWFAEIKRHTEVDALKVVTYAGQRERSLSSLEGALS